MLNYNKLYACESERQKDTIFGNWKTKELVKLVRIWGHKMEKKHQYHQEPMQEKTTRHAKMVGREEKDSIFMETSGREKKGVEEKKRVE